MCPGLTLTVRGVVLSAGETKGRSGARCFPSQCLAHFTCETGSQFGTYKNCLIFPQPLLHPRVSSAPQFHIVLGQSLGGESRNLPGMCRSEILRGRLSAAFTSVDSVSTLSPPLLPPISHGWADSPPKTVLHFKKHIGEKCLTHVIAVT